MGRPKKPIELLVHEGKTHLTKAQIEKRRKEELKVGFKNVTAPDYLPANLKEEFEEIAVKLIRLNIMTELDEDTLARYLLSKQQYLQYTSMLAKATKTGNVSDMDVISRLQDKAFKQCRSGASDLGLSVSSRCRLVVPEKEVPKENKFRAKFGGGAGGR